MVFFCFEHTTAYVMRSSDLISDLCSSDLPDILRGLSPQVKQLLQLSVEDIYRRFLARVAVARKMPTARVDEIGQGRVWAGATARKLGLVDHMRSETRRVGKEWVSTCSSRWSP